MKKIVSSLQSNWAFLAVGVLYLVTHVVSLTLLPVFADEAIYIRWAQLIVDDPLRYAFFALNDGKTPLFIWLLTPFQLLSIDQVLSARLVSVAIGLIQVGAIGWLTKILGGKRWSILLAMILTTTLPFWYFHHRLALIDSLLVLTLTFVWIGIVKCTTKDHFSWRWVLWSGLWLGAALWTKVPAILVLPTFITAYLVLPAWKRDRLIRLSLHLAGVSALGLGLFAAMKFVPGFGQLFSRGSDFLYPVSDVLNGAWRQTLPNFPTYIGYFIAYLSLPLLTFILGGLFLPAHKRAIHMLFWSSVLFLLPITLLGKVVYPRYFMPMAIWLTVAGTLSIQSYVTAFITPLRADKKTSMGKLLLSGIILILMVANMLAGSGTFIGLALINPNALPLVAADKAQYLTEWSSGHGLIQTAALINSMRQNGTIAVATEGYFGTLPDGLTLYFHRRPVDGIFIDGIGQPVQRIPDEFKTRARAYQQSMLVVNSNRMLMKLDPDLLIIQYCRPAGTTCLQVWDLTDIVQQ